MRLSTSHPSPVIYNSNEDNSIYKIYYGCGLLKPNGKNYVLTLKWHPK